MVSPSDFRPFSVQIVFAPTAAYPTDYNSLTGFRKVLYRTLVLSHIIFIEDDQLTRVTLALTEERERAALHRGRTRRAHLTVDKFSGAPRVAHASYTQAAGCRLFLDGTAVETTSDDVDFPFFALCQAPIGHVQTETPPDVILSYKCRKTGQLYLRSVDAKGEIGPERVVTAPGCIGGMDFAISGESVLFRVDAAQDGKLITHTAQSPDRGATISGFAPISLGDFEPDTHLPATSPVFRDYLGNFHTPVATAKGDSRHLFDVMNDAAVESLVISSNGGSYSVAAFPKKPLIAGLPQAALGRGDGITDGIGIIATAVDQGDLLVSNSQAGGIYYPQARLLNHEMPKVFAFKATECCYTRAQKPNTVSMDYVFLECDERGAPISRQLIVETWDMPLPTPQVRASAQGAVIRIEILKDAWFEIGKTIFTFNDPTIVISAVTVIDGRTAEVTTDGGVLRGLTVTFETKTAFYWHEGSALID